MKLYYCETLNPRKACAVARHLPLPVDFVRIDLASGEHRRPPFLAINPNGKVPVLQDGDWSLWESNAIMCHLSDMAQADLWPHDRRQVEVMRWLSWDSQHFTRHAGTLWFEYLIKPHLGLGEPDPVTGMVFDLKKLKDLIQQTVLDPMDHRFLNHEVPPFDKIVPTTENVAAEIWKRLDPHFETGRARLHNIRLYETEDLYVDYGGEAR